MIRSQNNVYQLKNVKKKQYTGMKKLIVVQLSNSVQDIGNQLNHHVQTGNSLTN